MRYRGKKKTAGGYRVYEGASEVIFGLDTLQACNTFLEEYVKDTRPDLIPGTDDYNAHVSKWYTVGKA
ncbi:Uncharacterised protein [uncultured archaeon]|nr:Uncharacterised protein [uncultured archaeon]